MATKNQLREQAWKGRMGVTAQTALTGPGSLMSGDQEPGAQFLVLGLKN